MTKSVEFSWLRDDKTPIGVYAPIIEPHTRMGEIHFSNGADGFIRCCIGSHGTDALVTFARKQKTDPSIAFDIDKIEQLRQWVRSEFPPDYFDEDLLLGSRGRELQDILRNPIVARPVQKR